MKLSTADYIELEQVALRPLNRRDEGDLHRIFTDDETMKYWSTYAHTSIEQTREMMARHFRADCDHAESTWALCLRTDANRCLGWISFYEFRDRICEVGYILNRAYWGKRMMSEALSATLHHAFQHWSLHRVEARLHPDNLRSKILLQKMGFSIEGHQRQNFLRDGVYEDTLLMGRLSSVDQVHF